MALFGRIEETWLAICDATLSTGVKTGPAALVTLETT